MKKVFLFIGLAFVSITFFGLAFVKISDNPLDLFKTKPKVELKTGDIIFQGNDLGQSKAVRLATHG